MNWINDPVWSFVGVAVGIAGIWTGYFFYRRSRLNRRLYFDSRFFQLISSDVASVPDLEFTYKKTPLHDLSVLKVIIWNAGSEIINSADIASTDQLRLVMPTGSVLLAKLLYQTHDTNCFTLGLSSTDPTTVNIPFEYVAPGQGAILLLLVSQGASAPPRLDGTIKGFGNPAASEAKEIIQSRAAYLAGGIIGMLPWALYALLRLWTDLPSWSVLTITLCLLVVVLTSRRHIARPLARSIRLLPPRMGIDRQLIERFEGDFKAADIA